MNIILVHGFLNRGGILRRLARHLTAAGHTCFTPSLQPCDARYGLPSLAEKLKCAIEKTLPEDSRFAIVGFSMGALVSRYYLQELEGHRRVDAYFSIAGPHGGTISAYLYPSRGISQLRPKSAFLVDLNRSAARLALIPTTCYWTPFDLMIRPLASARWPQSEVVRIPALAHSLLIFDRRLYHDIENRLSAIQPKLASEHQTYRE